MRVFTPLTKKPTASKPQPAVATSKPSTLDSFALVRAVLSSPGKPLERRVREQAERAFGRSFGDVRVHAGPAAQEAAEALGAQALTAGRDVLLGHDVEAGRMSLTLAHELAHVAQTGERVPRGTPPLSSTSSAEERSAEVAGARAANGQKVGAMTPAPPALFRKQTPMPVVKQQIIAKGHDDISELAKLIPNSGNGIATLKEATINGAKHVFVLDFHVVQQSTTATMLTGKNAETYETMTTKGTPPSQTTTHTITMSFASGIIGNPVEVVFHELVHARILIDKSLPESDRGDTYRRYAQLFEMATDPALLTVTGTTAKKGAVIKTIQGLRSHVSAVPGFNPASLGPATTDDALYEFMINEKFTTTESSSVVVGKGLANDVIASRYASAARARLESGITGQAFRNYKNSNIQALVDASEEALKDALFALYLALDAQLQKIADAKKNGLPGAAKSPTAPSVLDFTDPLLSRPLDISGKPIGIKSP